jgi:hypothetical protein
MVWYTIVTVAVLGFIVWFVRTPAFKAHRRGHGKVPGQDAIQPSPWQFNDRHGFRKNG